MRKAALVPMLLGTALLGAGVAQAAPRGTPDTQLAKALQGRTAGKPVNCIRLMDIDTSQIIDKTAILYTTRNGTVYVNRPTSGAEQLRSYYTLVTDTHTNQLCSIDTVKLYDSASRISYGWVGLGDFVPYAKPRKG
ncbi:hypothetical protein [Sphingomonas quercus]|uniref:Uncharacterized protein n=1 Tax=Sphingomonas quercus TaxID=2842451 RepID=A0ABS6BMC8_9SPHN|nr:hypothetical protein [Sphingomonas quercus]MBU3079339.1 hypothetical protein [Sphingomonas quercus]